jgi:hypothetical protein
MICQKCKKENSPPIQLHVVEFACKYCNALNLLGKNTLHQSNKSSSFPLKIGDTFVYEEKTFFLVASMEKSTRKVYKWREYIFKSIEGITIVLSESNNHWMILKEANLKDLSLNRHSLNFEDEIYHLYNKNKARVDYFEGFAEEIVNNFNCLVYDYIAPPKIISIEKYYHNTSQKQFIGTYLNKRQLRKWFPNRTFLSSFGLGMLEPRKDRNNTTFTMILMVFAFALILFNIYFENQQRSKKVLEEFLSFSDFGPKKAYASNSFELKGNFAAPMHISLLSNLVQDWAEIDISLIDDKTNEELYTTKSMEYYYGIEDGESWSEGSNSSEVKICGIKPGKYHFELVPYNARNTSTPVENSIIPSDAAPSFIQIKAIWAQPSNWNILFILILFFVIGGIKIYYGYNFEFRRWEDSDFDKPY